MKLTFASTQEEECQEDSINKYLGSVAPVDSVPAAWSHFISIIFLCLGEPCFTVARLKC